MTSNENAKGPIIVWQYFGYEGWSPTSFPDIKSALMAERYSSEFVITSAIEFDVVSQSHCGDENSSEGLSK